MSLRPAWSTKCVLGQPELNSETRLVKQKTKTKTTTKTKKKKERKKKRKFIGFLKIIIKAECYCDDILTLVIFPLQGGLG